MPQIPSRIPEQFQLAADSGVDTGLIERQFDDASLISDADGVGYLATAQNCTVTLVTDTTSRADVPEPYRHHETRITAISSSTPNRGVEVVAGIETPRSKAVLRTSSGHEGAIQHLLGIVGVDLTEFEVYPELALEPIALHFAEPDYMIRSQRQIRKIFDPNRTETDAIHLTMTRISEKGAGMQDTAYHANFGRPLRVGGDYYTYWQYFSQDNRRSGLWGANRAFYEPFGSVQMGWNYNPRSHGPELNRQALTDLERRIGAASILTGALDAGDFSRLIREPLSQDYALRLRRDQLFMVGQIS